MKIGFAQINPTVGDLRGNCELIVRAYERLAAAGAELVLTPELAMTGYPPQDLVLKSRFVPENLELLAKLHACVGDAALLVGFVDRNDGRGKPFRNAAALLERGKPIRKTHKSLLPTYDVFDEDRYWAPRSVVVPSPSCPKPLAPQHLIPPLIISAQVWVSPAAIALTPLVNPLTSAGVAWFVFVPSPSWPQALYPQHLIPPPIIRAQV